MREPIQRISFSNLTKTEVDLIIITSSLVRNSNVARVCLPSCVAGPRTMVRNR